MRVLHVIRSLDPGHGGPTFCVNRLASAQSGVGHDVSILFFGGVKDEQSARAALDPLPGGRGVRLCAIEGRAVVNGL